MTICLEWIKETPKAVQYRRDDGAVLWIPRSVMASEVLSMPAEGKPQRVRVNVHAWWLIKNLQRNDVMCRCAHVTTFGSTFFATKQRVQCECCARWVESPVLRV